MEIEKLTQEEKDRRRGWRHEKHHPVSQKELDKELIVKDVEKETRDCSKVDLQDKLDITNDTIDRLQIRKEQLEKILSTFKE